MSTAWWRRWPKSESVSTIVKCHASSVNSNLEFFNRFTIGDTKSWGQFSRVEPKRIKKTPSSLANDILC